MPPEPRPVRLHLFTSNKGGVGKSTLAVLLARTRAQQPGAGVLVLDADFTGVSLAEALLLRAPDVDPDPLTRQIDLERPRFRGWLDRPATTDLMDRRLLGSRRDPVRELPYLNQVLRTFEGRPPPGARIPEACWVEGSSDASSPWFLPCSNDPDDQSTTLAWASPAGPVDPFLTAFYRLLLAAVTQMPTLTDIVIDVPPSAYGIARKLTRALRSLTDASDWPVDAPRLRELPITWLPSSYLILGPNRGDLQQGLSGWVRTSAPRPRVVVNRFTDGRAQLGTYLRPALRDGLARLGALDSIHVIVDHPLTMGRLFLDGGGPSSPEEERERGDALGLGGAA